MKRLAMIFKVIAIGALFVSILLQVPMGVLAGGNDFIVFSGSKKLQPDQPVPAWQFGEPGDESYGRIGKISYNSDENDCSTVGLGYENELIDQQVDLRARSIKWQYIYHIMWPIVEMLFK